MIKIANNTLKRTFCSLKAWVFPVFIVVILWFLLAPASSKSFDEKGYDIKNLMGHIDHLDSSTFGGRLPGTPGNLKAVAYIKDTLKKYGVQPVKGSSLEQAYFAQIPIMGDNPVFDFEGSDGKIKHMEIYQDYRYCTMGMSGSMDYSGDVLYVGRNFYSVPASLMKGKVVVVWTTGYNEDIEKRAIEVGVKGLLTYRHDDILEDPEAISLKSTSMHSKPGPSIGNIMMAPKMVAEMEKAASQNPIKVEGIPKDDLIGIIHQGKIRQTIDFKPVRVSNVIGMIPGKDKDNYVMFGAHLDHVGNAKRGAYFPGALDNASGTAMVLEIARWCHEQKLTPEKTILFAFWNAEEEGLLGSRYYVRHPLVPLNQTENINVDMVGGKNSRSIIISYLNSASQVPASRVYQYGEFLNLKMTYAQEGGTDHVPFSENGGRAIQINSGSDNYHHVTDTLEASISADRLAEVASVLGYVLKYDVYSLPPPNVPAGSFKWILILMILTVLMLYGVAYWHQHAPDWTFFGVHSEDLRFSPLYNIAGFAASTIVPMIMVVVLVFLSQIPKDLNLIQSGHGYESNFSVWLTLKKTLIYLQSLVTHGLTVNKDGLPLGLYIGETFLKSGVLLFASVILAFPLGIAKGLYDARKPGARKTAGVLAGNVQEFRGFSSILLLSVPDVLWVFLANSLMIFLGNLDGVRSGLPGDWLRGWLMPWLTLSVMPFIYISRIAYTAFLAEKGKSYVMGLKSKGFDWWHIYTRHLLSPVVETTLHALQGLLVILISNLVVIEYLFDYKGLTNQILMMEDQTTIITLTMALTALYALSRGFVQIAQFLASPRKKWKIRSF